MWRKKTASERKADTIDRMATLEGLLKSVENLHDHFMMCEGSWGVIGVQEYERMLDQFHRAKCAQGRVKESYVGDHRSEGEGGAVEDWSDTSSNRHYEEG